MLCPLSWRAKQRTFKLAPDVESLVGPSPEQADHYAAPVTRAPPTPRERSSSSTESSGMSCRQSWHPGLSMCLIYLAKEHSQLQRVPHIHFICGRPPQYQHFPPYVAFLFAESCILFNHSDSAPVNSMLLNMPTQWVGNVAFSPSIKPTKKRSFLLSRRQEVNRTLDVK